SGASETGAPDGDTADEKIGGASADAPPRYRQQPPKGPGHVSPPDRSQILPLLGPSGHTVAAS
ncbi:MAG: hypothetical protein M3R02_25350, partial [Chloroflexota bacterium]|nr:hypothetical protein [Chloroflexota bacterium]